MFKARFTYCAAVLFLVFFSLVCRVYAVDDGFGSSRKAAGKYFDVYYDSSTDALELAQQLDISQSDVILAGSSVASGSLDLADMVDVLYARISEILDMHVYSFKGTIKVCSNQAHLGRVYERLFGGRFQGERSFYADSLNTIYITAASFQRGILGHEIAHAIISRYFVVPPPVRAAEVLAGYVEYQLRKASR